MRLALPDQIGCALPAHGPSAQLGIHVVYACVEHTWRGIVHHSLTQYCTHGSHASRRPGVLHRLIRMARRDEDLKPLWEELKNSSVLSPILLRISSEAFGKVISHESAMPQEPEPLFPILVRPSVIALISQQPEAASSSDHNHEWVG